MENNLIELSLEEQLAVDGGETYWCSCGFETTDAFKASFHWGTHTWHILKGYGVK